MTDSILEDARTRELERIAGAIDDACDRGDVALVVTLERLRKAALHRGWQPPRPPRRMPSLWRIACYWDERDTFGDIHLGRAPFCFGCHKHARWHEFPTHEDRWNDASHFLDRAHLVTRDMGGLDGPQNVVPLCERCHKMMPFFGVGDKRAAIRWIQEGGRLSIPGQVEREIAELEAIYAAGRGESREKAAMSAGGQYPLW